MFIFWNKTLELPIHSVSYAANLSLVALHNTLNLPPCAVWKATSIFLLFSCVLMKECILLCIYIHYCTESVSWCCLSAFCIRTQFPCQSLFLCSDSQGSNTSALVSSQSSCVLCFILECVTIQYSICPSSVLLNWWSFQRLVSAKEFVGYMCLKFEMTLYMEKGSHEEKTRCLEKKKEIQAKDCVSTSFIWGCCRAAFWIFSELH